mgnify:CR=1 FL=1
MSSSDDTLRGKVQQQFGEQSATLLASGKRLDRRKRSGRLSGALCTGGRTDHAICG